MKHLMTSLYAWADAFGRVIGISPDSISEAFDTSKMVFRTQVVPVSENLETVVRELFAQFSLLVDSMNYPFRLLEAMHTLETLHYGLLNPGVSKYRPPPSLLEAPSLTSHWGTAFCGASSIPCFVAQRDHRCNYPAECLEDRLLQGYVHLLGQTVGHSAR